MTNLLEEIKGINDGAARKLAVAGYCTDLDIKSLNTDDLLELLPGDNKIQVRKKVYEVICRFLIQQNPFDAVLTELKILTHDKSFRGPLLNYIHTLKEIRAEVVHVEEILDAHIDLLERLRESNAEKVNKDHTVSSVNHASSTGSSAASSAASDSVTNTNTWHGFSLPDISVPKFFSGLRSSGPQTQVPSSFARANDSCNQPLQNASSNTGRGLELTIATVAYKMVVCGNTLNRHLDVLEMVKGAVPGHSDFLELHETKHDDKSQVTIVFCPVVSRMGTDVEAALGNISSDKPIILVAMHHMHSPKLFMAPGPYPKVQLSVNIFFHETVNGLLRCTQNHEAINAIKIKLLEHSTKKIQSSRIKS